MSNALKRTSLKALDAHFGNGNYLGLFCMRINCEVQSRRNSLHIWPRFTGEQRKARLLQSHFSAFGKPYAWEGIIHI